MSQNNQIIEKLKLNPLYQISMSSIELFHSNLWVWLLRKYPQSISVFLNLDQPLQNFDHLEIEREYRNTDLYIKNGNTIYLIENKIKSLPEQSQLAKYEEKFNDPNHTVKGFVTGFVDPNFDSLPNWTFISYQEIANRIDLFLTNHQNHLLHEQEFDYQLLKHYVDMIRNLSTLVHSSFDSDLPYKLSTPLNEIGFEVVYKKLLASKMADELFRQERFQLLIDRFAIAKIKGRENSIRTSINNNQLTFSIDFDTNIKNTYIGIQLGDYAYRKFAGIWFDQPRTISEENPREDKKKLAKDAFDQLSDEFPQWLEKGKKYNQYITEWYSFVYQVDEMIESNTPLNALYDRIFNDLVKLTSYGYVKLKKEN